jgi:hypothetical protein
VGVGDGVTLGVAVGDGLGEKVTFGVGVGTGGFGPEHVATTATRRTAKARIMAARPALVHRSRRGAKFRGS